MQTIKPVVRERSVFAACLAIIATTVSATVAAWQVPTEAPIELPYRETIPAEFAGTWDYNHVDSVNAATGRPEQAPRSATQRGAPATGRGGGGGAPSAPTPRAGGGIGVGGGRNGGELSIGPSPAMMREARDMSRDLLEVPEALDIALKGDAIAITDDIERERVYPLDGSKNKYRLGASEFSARVRWTGKELRKEIEGSFGFKMTETYFLSPDAERLFVIIRVTTEGRSRQLQGFNRVYDRVAAGSRATPGGSAPLP